MRQITATTNIEVEVLREALELMRDFSDDQIFDDIPSRADQFRKMASLPDDELTAALSEMRKSISERITRADAAQKLLDQFNQQ